MLVGVTVGLIRDVQITAQELGSIDVELAISGTYACTLEALLATVVVRITDEPEAGVDTLTDTDGCIEVDMLIDTDGGMLWLTRLLVGAGVIDETLDVGGPAHVVQHFSSASDPEMKAQIATKMADVSMVACTKSSLRYKWLTANKIVDKAS